MFISTTAPSITHTQQTTSAIVRIGLNEMFGLFFTRRPQLCGTGRQFYVLVLPFFVSGLEGESLS